MHLHEVQNLIATPGIAGQPSGTTLMPISKPTIVEQLRVARGAIKSKEHAATVNRAVILINTIVSFLDGTTWNSETVESIAEALRNEGLDVRDSH